jgi:nitrite reductase (NADH) small subunit
VNRCRGALLYEFEDGGENKQLAWGKWDLEMFGKKLVRICGVGELPPEGEVGEFQAGKLTLCVAKMNGQVYAMENECPHHGGPLGQGRLEDGKVLCPWHAYAFDVKTGECTGAIPVRVFEVTVAREDVLVKV